MGIDPETYRLVAQCLNHYATPGPSVFLNSGRKQNEYLLPQIFRK